MAYSDTCDSPCKWQKKGICTIGAKNMRNVGARDVNPKCMSFKLDKKKSDKEGT